MLPGVAHIDSITNYHLEVPKEAPESVGLGKFDHNVMRFDIEEAARMAGLDFKIGVVVNERAETAGVFATPNGRGMWRRGVNRGCRWVRWI